jgi:Right handed beta helix region
MLDYWHAHCCSDDYETSKSGNNNPERNHMLRIRQVKGVADTQSAKDARPSLGLHRSRGVMLAGVVSFLAIIAGAVPALALPVCTASVGACCKITSANTYNLTGTVTALASGDCIRITTPGVILNLNSFDMVGFNSTGAGIHVLSTATGAVVNGGADLGSLTPSSISNFATGIRNDASNSFIFDFVTQGNGGSGVVNNGVGATFAEFKSSNNHGGGAMVDNASRATFLNFFADGNSSNGVVVNSPAPPAPPTSYVRLLSFDASNNTGSSGVVLNGIIDSFVEAGVVSTNGINGINIVRGSANSLSEIQADGNSGFGILLSNTSSNALSHSELSSNVNGGLKLKSSTGNRVGRVKAYSNSNGPGIWLFSSSRNSISDFSVCGNWTSGIYIGCSPTSLPAEVTCGASPGGNANVVANGTSQSNNVGVGIDTGNGNNRVLSTDSVNMVASTPCNGENTGDDLEDDNVNCDSNLWAMNVFTSVSPILCIH